MKKCRLSNSEEILLNTLWRAEQPLTSAQLSEQITEAKWNTNYINKVLNQLTERGLVRIDGFLQEGRYQSRRFAPCCTKEEYIADMLEEQGVNNALFARIAMALVKKSSKKHTAEQDEKLIAELEKMVDEYEAQQKEAGK